MCDISVCAACLATDVRMYSMSAASLLQPYRLLTGIESEGMPQKLCWECAALVHKFNMFRHKCERASLLLQEIYNQHDEITVTQVKNIDRLYHKLCSPYAVSQQSSHAVTHRRDKAGRSSKSSSNRRPPKEPTEETFIEMEAVIVKDEGVKLEDKIEFAAAFCSSDDEATQAESLRACETAGEHSKFIKTEFNATATLLTPDEARKVYSDRRMTKKYKKSKLKCVRCSQGFRDEATYEMHLQRHDPIAGEYECDICKRRFTTKDALGQHYTKHLKQFMCNVCSKVSYTKHAAKLHCEVHKGGGRDAMRAQKRIKLTAEQFEADETVLTQEQQREAVRERQNAQGFSTARFRCMLCYKPFNEDKTYANHMKQHDAVSGALECDICKLRYTTRLKIFKHITNNHMKRYSCKLCPHVCYNRSFALNHYRWHKGVVYQCDICGAKFDKKTSHRSHLRIKHPSEHVCAECAEPFVSLSGLQQHTNRMHTLKRDTVASGGEHETSGPYCAECDIQFTCKQAWTRHVLISPKHQHERHTITNGCQYCGETYESAAKLKSHYVAAHRRHKRTFKISPHKLFPAKCSQCEETMVSAGKYWQHFRQQHPGKPFPLTGTSFICEYCGNWFKYQSALDAHKRTHLEKHQCVQCPKKFVRAGSLAAHAESHEGQFSCDVCNRQFTYKRSLTNHFRTHTVERPHVCEWCGKSFAYDCNLKKHELTVHCTASAMPSHHMQIQ